MVEKKQAHICLQKQLQSTAIYHDTFSEGDNDVI